MLTLHQWHPCDSLGLGHCRAPAGHHHARPWFLTASLFIFAGSLLGLCPCHHLVHLQEHPSIIITSLQTAFQAAARGNYLQRPDLTLTLAMALLSCSYSSAGSASPHLPLLLLSQHPPTPHLQPNQIRAMSKQHTSYVLDTLLTLTNSDPYNTILLLN